MQCQQLGKHLDPNVAKPCDLKSSQAFLHDRFDGWSYFLINGVLALPELLRRCSLGALWSRKKCRALSSRDKEYVKS